ncbi:GreA/GreB family elongation factor [Lacinutrix undariae]
MKYGSLIIEKKEFVILKRLINLSGNFKDAVEKRSVYKLSKELETAIIQDGDEIPDDVIRFNSEITISSKDDWKHTFKLVLPTESDVSKHKISILSPMGTAVIGYAQDDEISWEFPQGIKQFKIEKVKQSNQVETLKYNL